MTCYKEFLKIIRHITCASSLVLASHSSPSHSFSRLSACVAALRSLLMRWNLFLGSVLARSFNSMAWLHDLSASMRGMCKNLKRKRRWNYVSIKLLFVIVIIKIIISIIFSDQHQHWHHHYHYHHFHHHQTSSQLSKFLSASSLVISIINITTTKIIITTTITQYIITPPTTSSTK